MGSLGYGAKESYWTWFDDTIDMLRCNCCGCGMRKEDEQSYRCDECGNWGWVEGDYVYYEGAGGMITYDELWGDDDD